MAPEIRKMRRNVTLGAILLPGMLLLLLGASYFMPVDLWMSWSFLVGIVVELGVLANFPPEG